MSAVKRILVPLDGSALAERALAFAGSIAKSSGAHVDAVLVHENLSLIAGTDKPWGDAMRRMEGEYLARAAAATSDQYEITVEPHLLDGPVADSLCTRVRRSHADLVVLTTHGRTGVSRAWLGSVADAVVRGTHVPVLMVRARELGPTEVESRPALHRILVPLDGSKLAESAIDRAVAFGEAVGTPSYVLFEAVTPVPSVDADYAAALGMQGFPLPLSLPDPEATDAVVASERANLDRLAVKLRARTQRPVETHVVVAEHAAPAILEAAITLHADLITMSTHGRGASRLLMGSVTDKVLRGTTVPLLVCRPSPSQLRTKTPMRMPASASAKSRRRPRAKARVR